MRLTRIWWLLAVVCQLPLGGCSRQEEVVQQQVESSLISLFGFKKRPKIDRSKIIIPKIMLDEYEKQTGKKMDTVNLKRPGITTRSANTMRSFLHVDSNLDSKFPGQHKFRLSFDVSSIPTSEVLKTAELVLTREKTLQEDDDYLQTVVVHDILRPGVKGKSKPSLRVIDVKRVDTRRSGQLSLDVQPAVLRRREQPKHNHGLLVQVLGKSKARHLRLRRDLGVEEGEDEWESRRPVLLAYTDDGRYKTVTGAEIMEKRRRRRAASKKRKPKFPCRRYSMYVDFLDVGWSDWIVAPPGYDAYYCSGECAFPFPEHLNTTNHAIVQTLMNSVNPHEGVPRACCVPTHLNSISMLYLDDEKRVVLKNYKDMTVVGCGCR